MTSLGLSFLLVQEWVELGEVAGRRILGDMLLSFLEPLPCSSSHHPEVMMIIIQDKVKKAEGRTIDAFKLWCWRILLRVPWTVRRLNQSIWKEINPEYLLEGMMLRLQYFGHVMWRANSFEKTLMLGKTEGRRRRLTEDKRVEWHHWLSGHEFEQTPGNSEGQGSLVCCSPWDHTDSNTTGRPNNRNSGITRVLSHRNKSTEAGQIAGLNSGTETQSRYRATSIIALGCYFTVQARMLRKKQKSPWRLFLSSLIISVLVRL